MISILFLDEVNDLLLGHLSDVPTKIRLLSNVRPIGDSIQQGSSNTASVWKKRTKPRRDITVPITLVPMETRVAEIAYVDIQV